MASEPKVQVFGQMDDDDVEEKVNIGTTEKPDYITRITPLADWIDQQKAADNSNNGD